jgi:aspartokinase
MVTVAQVTKKIVEQRPIIQNAMIEGIINYANLAEKLLPNIEAELGYKVKPTAVMMALRRHTDGLQKKSVIKRDVEFNPEIVMKTNLCDVTIVKTHTAQQKITEIYKLVDYEKNETLNIIQGNYEITIVISQRYLEKLKKILKSEKILNVETDLVSLTLELSNEFLYTPGILSLATQKLAWENVNIFENISTLTELIFIISEKDAVRGYNTFKELLKKQMKKNINKN